MSKKISLILITLGIVFAIIGVTISYYIWSSSSKDNTLITFTVSNNFSCSADGGGNITSGDVNLVPTEVNDSTVGNYIKREVKVYPQTVSGVTIYMDLWLTVNSIDSGLSNSTNFMYAFTTGSTGPTDGVVVSGNINGASAGDKINLLTQKEYASTLTDTYYLWIWLSADESNTDTMNQSFSLSLGGSCADSVPIPTGAQMLINNANPSTLTYADATDSQKKEMWTFSHDATEQVPATIDFRYIGSTPNNYITYNDEVWRIIGVFDGRIKIIRDKGFSYIPWDWKQNSVGSSTSSEGSNDWADSQLMYMLNPTSYTLKDGYMVKDNMIYDASSNIIYQLGCKPETIAVGATTYSCTTNSYSLSETALSQIDEATYYLGGRTYDSTTHWGNAEEIYTWERGTTVYSGRPTSWTGLVGLMYPSDYVYTFANGVNDTCYTDVYNCNDNGNSWLYWDGYGEWTISPYSSDDNGVFLMSRGFLYYASSSGYAGDSSVDYLFSARQVVYLKSDIQLTGTGDSTDPYRIVS